MTIVTETRHPLSLADQALEVKILAAMNEFRSSFNGTVREWYDALLEQTPVAEGVVIEAANSNSVDGYWVTPEGASAERALVFIHGGGYALGSASSYCGFASQLASRTGVRTLVPDYPLAPEHPFPAACDAIFCIPSWLEENGIAHYALIGDSAGAGLVLGLLQTPAVNAAVNSAVVFSPYLDLAFTGESFNNPETYDPIFRPEILTEMAATYLNGSDPTNPSASPLYGVSKELPPLAIQVGSDELLLDDATRYASTAAAFGGEVLLDIYEGMHHVFQSNIDLEASRHALDSASAFITKHWRS